LVQFGASLPEPLRDLFEARPPSGKPWPAGLPSCPALAEFYALCDGGRFYPYEVLPLRNIAKETASLRDWVGDDADDEAPAGPWLVLGRHAEVDSHVLVWDVAADRVGLYSADNGWIFDEEGGWSFAGGSPAALWEGLFFPPAKSRDEMERLWHQALGRLDGLA
jgi:hypothetical protein